ncbi:hypothetical protein ANCCAN_23281 [Ancylostoma caninum]|uniref:Uncharacterized protein n=1 Tax=Ancylostoma caninum TaxID=29170 RepID=A0A368FFL6_ANCCA|nr:hypothetical protein ANCCAN_23281 [Ancylostoma caninum]
MLEHHSSSSVKERIFIVKIAERLFSSSQDVSAGIWTYGYSNNRILKIKDDTMCHNFKDFSKEVDSTMQIQNAKKLRIDNDRVISVINSCHDKYRHANCLVFFSGVNDISVWKKKSELKEGDGYQKLNMTRDAGIRRLVAVSLKSVDFIDIVIPPVGIAVKASANYSDDDVVKVVEAILGESTRSRITDKNL